jgi:uncharacterized membrane protein
MTMDVYVIVLRLLHVIGGLFWAGSGFYLAWFVQPAARVTGDAGGVVMRHLMGESRAPAAIGVAAVSTVVSGVLLYWYDFGAVVPFNRSMGAFAVGGVAAIVVWVLGVTVMLPGGRRMERLGARAGTGEEVGAEMAETSSRMARVSQISTWLLVLAVISMAVARYL